MRAELSVKDAGTEAHIGEDLNGRLAMMLRNRALTSQQMRPQFLREI